MSKLTDALRRRFRTPQEALRRLGLDAGLLAQDAETKHDPKTGQFTAGPNSKPSSSEEHYSQAKWHEAEANKPGVTNLAKRQHMQKVKHHIRMGGGPTRTGLEANKDRALAGDSKEKDMSNTRLSPTAILAVGAIDHYLRPRMAADAAIPIIPLFRGVTAANFAERTPGILAGIRRATRGRLAADADIEDLGDVLDRIDELADEGREALGEARAEEEGEEHAEAEGGETDEEAKDSPELLAQIREFLADKLGPEDLAHLDEMIAAEAPTVPAAGDEGETDEEKAKHEAERRVNDAALASRPTKAAMDAAIKAAVTKATTGAIANERAIRTALGEVRPYVGDLDLAFDSAEEVYRHALESMGVAEANTIHASALKTVLGLQPRPGQRAAPRLASDAAASAKSFAERFPNSARVGRA